MTRRTFDMIISYKMTDTVPGE